MKTAEELIKHIELEQLDNALFRGNSEFMGSPNVFGGQVLAQALHAARKTVPEDRIVHSLHSYFILPGNLSKPIIYQVGVTRDGGSFTTRRVTAIQNGKTIFILAASFQLVQEGYDHQIDMPKVPGPEECSNMDELAKRYEKDWPDLYKAYFKIDRPLEFRPVQDFDMVNPGVRAPKYQLWMRVKGEVPVDPALNRELLTYASDYNLLVTARLPHGNINFTNTQFASLDHAMYFHRDFKLDQWLLFDIESSSASNARGFARGKIFTEEGQLVSTVIQEGLMRKMAKA